MNPVILELIDTQVSIGRNPYIASYRIKQGMLRTGMILKGMDGVPIGPVVRILTGTIQHNSHRYVEYATEGENCALLINSNTNKIHLHLIA